MKLQKESEKLHSYINSLHDFNFIKKKEQAEHLGAVIADAVLQVGHHYKNIVEPRVEKIRSNYPNHTTISSLEKLSPGDVGEFLQWKGKDVQERFIRTVKFFHDQNIEIFADLRNWIKDEVNWKSLIHDSKIGMIGKKTADYYRILVRLPDAVKVDDRIDRFLKNNGILEKSRKYSYEDKRSIVQTAARLLNMKPIDFDFSIWEYMGNESNKDGIKKYTKNSDSPNMSLIKAKSFAMKHGLNEQVEWIDNLSLPKEWSTNNFRNARQGKYIELFVLKGLWENFIQIEWPQGKTHPGLRGRYKTWCKELTNFLKANGQNVPWELSDKDWNSART